MSERYTSPPGWVAEQLGVSSSTVTRWAKAGQIPAVVIGGRWLVHWKELKRRIDEEACAQHDLVAQSVPEGEKVCRTKEMERRTGGLTSKRQTEKELDALLGRPIAAKQKRSKAS